MKHCTRHWTLTVHCFAYGLRVLTAGYHAVLSKDVGTSVVESFEGDHPCWQHLAICNDWFQPPAFIPYNCIVACLLQYHAGVGVCELKLFRGA